MVNKGDKVAKKVLKETLQRQRVSYLIARPENALPSVPQVTFTPHMAQAGAIRCLYAA